MLNLKEGELLVKLARKAVQLFVSRKEILKPSEEIPAVFKEERGVFVTLNKLSSKGKELRGCIGYSEPVLPLIDALIKAAIAAATEDIRFYPPYGPGPVTPEELEEIVFEVTVLTKPELITVNDPREYLGKIKIGRDGLIVERGFRKGLLLPQVPVEWKWDVEEFLSHTCMKAGLTPDAWLLPDTKVYAFQGQIFEEEYPNGPVVEKKISTCS
ncbi:MAG: TIGR00296 family protein [Candidatus Odinarchaeia archaeon]